MKRCLVALLGVLALAVPATALADGDHGSGVTYADHKIKNGDQIDVGNDAAPRGKLKISKKDAPTPATIAATAPSAAAVSALQSPPLGTQRIWPMVNFVTGAAQLFTFTLQSVGAHSEIWVANNLSFPNGDCRNDGIRNVVTKAQTDYLLDQFDNHMYPIESQYFSTPPSREGTNAALYTILPSLFPKGYFSGPGDKIVTLVGNVRDENYSTITFPSYVAGYHSSGINSYVDRNVMTIDAYDWFHRTGATPPNEPSTELCQNKPAKPFSYEATFAHEYQHLLEFWASPGEKTWVNEGLSEFAMGLTGYAATTKTIDELGWDGHIQTFLGWRLKLTPFNAIAQPNGGAENSLTAWEDQGNLETLADYGATFTFHEMLANRYGSAFMSDLHNEDVNGIPGLQKVLDKYLTGKTAEQLIHEWAAMVALDRSLDDGANLRGRPAKADYQVDSLHSAVYWENPQSYDTPGAPPNGSDYVALRDGSGKFLSAAQIKSIDFSGHKTHNLLPVTWIVDAAGRPGDAALFSPPANNLNRMIIRDVTVPAGASTLTFDLQHSLEQDWDYAFVQVSTDNGATWKSLANANTTTAHDPQANAAIVAQLPGFTGDAAWHGESFDLSAYAGKSVLLAFRNMTDGSVTGNDAGISAGVWIDNIALNGQSLSDGSSLAGWRSEVSAPSVNGYTVQLVGLSSSGGASILSQIPLDGNFAASLSGGPLRRLIGDEVELVGAIVTYDEPTETITRYAPYELRVNGVLQPGG